MPLPQSCCYPNLSEGVDSVGGQLCRDKECPFSGVTSSGRVWRKVAKKRCRECATQGHLRMITCWRLLLRNHLNCRAMFWFSSRKELSYILSLTVCCLLPYWMRYYMLPIFSADLFTWSLSCVSWQVPWLVHFCPAHACVQWLNKVGHFCTVSGTLLCSVCYISASWCALGYSDCYTFVQWLVHFCAMCICTVTCMHMCSDWYTCVQ